MGRRLALLALAVALGLAGATGAALAAGSSESARRAGDTPDDLAGQKEQVDSKLQQLKSSIAVLQQKEAAIRGEIVQVNGRIQALEGKVGTVSTQLSGLRRDLSLRKQRLAALRELYRLETRRLVALGAEYRKAVRHLEQRIVKLYQQEDPTTLDVVLSAASIQDVLDNLEFVEKINAQDRKIVSEVAMARTAMTKARARTKRVAAGVQQEARVIAARASQVSVVRDQLLAERGRLASARDDKRQSLDTLTAQEREEAEEMDALAAASARLSDQIKAAQEAARRAAEAAGRQQSSAPGALQWPSQGPVTSPFGQRWGRSHTGIDIGAPMGAPIVASAAGTVIVAGWVDGYGSTVVIDHGGGIATLYGHQSQILVGVGATVGAGQQIGAIGSTGRSTGPHLHFEVRVSGTPVDPLGYL